MGKHTKSPWTCIVIKQNERTYVEVHSGAQIVMEATAYGRLPDEEVVANGNLAAAAPELLTTLQVLLDAVDYTARGCGYTEMISAVLDQKLIQKARAVIAKAEGGAR